ncbi:MAG: aspartate aminotransferase family protein [Acidimicrobiales bacterium]
MDQPTPTTAAAELRNDLPALLHPFARPAAPAASYIDIVSAKGSEVTDSAGRTYFDALASLWYCNVGHGRPEIADAVSRQLRTLDAFHTFDRFTNPPTEELAEKLAALAPMQDSRVFFTCGGSESVETALKLVRMAHFLRGEPDRTVVISRRPSYHGVTYGAMTATGLPANQEGFGPLLGDVVQVPHDDLAALDALAEELPGRVAAVIAEPVVGSGGVYPSAPGYLEGLRERCDRWGAFLVLDEVICGFGRLGSWWAAQHYGVRPDLVTFAKGVTSGYIPLGGVLVGSAVRGALEAEAGFVLRHGNTYAGHPAATAAGLATLAIMEDEGLVGRSSVIADTLGKGLASLVDGSTVVETRGVEGVWAIGLGPAVDATALRDALLERGVIARPIGSSTLAYCPPLVSTTEQLSSCVERTAEALSALHRRS